MSAMPDHQRRQAIFDGLCRGEASFHGWWDEKVVLNWQLDEAVLRFLWDRVGEGAQTLETGCGYSTVAFALAGARHTAVSPFAVEHERIQAWCEDRDVPTDHMVFVAEPSQDALPRLEPTPLDLVLIDGDHAFPLPFVDWFYTAHRLKIGGLCVVDDTQIPTGGILHRFLAAETGRWRLVEQFTTTSVFEKLSDPVLDPSGWIAQPFCQRHVPLKAESEVVSWLRDKVRLRTRARRLFRLARHRG
jgi:hypothetical protein